VSAILTVSLHYTLTAGENCIELELRLVPQKCIGNHLLFVAFTDSSVTCNNLLLSLVKFTFLLGGFVTKTQDKHVFRVKE